MQLKQKVEDERKKKEKWKMKKKEEKNTIAESPTWKRVELQRGGEPSWRDESSLPPTPFVSSLTTPTLDVAAEMKQTTDHQTAIAN